MEDYLLYIGWPQIVGREYEEEEDEEDYLGIC